MATKTPKVVTEEKKNKKYEFKLTQRELVILAAIVLGVILLLAYFYNWTDIKNKQKLQTSYLVSSGTVSLEINNLEEVSQILSEAPSEYFILITYTKDEQEYELEKGLKSIIDNYNLNSSFYYLNVENIKNEENYLARINNTFNTDKVKQVPTILYYKDNEIVDVVTRNDDNCIKAADFQKLLDIYEYEGH